MTSVADAVAVLNRALAADRKAISGLFENRFLCNSALRDDPTIQVEVTTYLPGILFEMPVNVLTVLGLINGIFGVDEQGRGHIVAVVDDGTGRLLRFEER